jgi:hypothetical protein
MVEPSRRVSRLTIAAGAASAIVLVAGGFVLGRTTSSSPQPVEAAPPSAPTVAVEKQTPVLPASPLLGRAELIAAAAAAADSFASSAGAPPVSELEGRRFELRLPFGCRGPAAPEDDAPLRWRYNEERGTLRLHARPEHWAPEEWLGSAAAERVEAIEGFWISRPWSSSEACPRVEAAPANGSLTPSPPQETLGVAEFFRAGSSRLTRRGGEAYETVKKVAPEALNTSMGFRLRLQGHVATLPDGRSFICRAAAGPEQRPVCLLAVSLDTVSFENPATGDTLATWDVASESSAHETIR